MSVKEKGPLHHMHELGPLHHMRELGPLHHMRELGPLHHMHADLVHVLNTLLMRNNALLIYIYCKWLVLSHAKNGSRSTRPTLVCITYSQTHSRCD